MPSAIFLDSGGVINDNAQRAPQWIRYLGEFLPTTILGGTAQVWGQANAQIVRPFFSRWYEYMAQATEMASKAQDKAINLDGKDRNLVESGQDRDTNVYWIFERLQLLIWIKEMCKVAIPHIPGLESKIMPSLSDDEYFEIARSAHLYVIQRVKADYPGAVDTIRELSGKSGTSSQFNHKLYTSSGDCYEDLECIFKGLGVYECFDEIYGSDKINCLKVSPKFYEKVFERVGLCVVSRGDDNKDDGGNGSGDSDGSNQDRDEVVVLDDSIKALRWARALGARTVLVTDIEIDLSLEGHDHIDYQIKALSELPSLLQSWKVHLEGRSQ
ncbi:hypothetical protein BGX27_001961 [Mortierella sp. AM989]|nr:hypothetical protein BGX27_001961 [Mortierella sp. AM989]